eukprot:Hpha_TRINITY_DN15899_c1_g11::TRINITY_DN15899_c1_g11_i1::g.190870::m.190870
MVKKPQTDALTLAAKAPQRVIHMPPSVIPHLAEYTSVNAPELGTVPLRITWAASVPVEDIAVAYHDIQVRNTALHLLGVKSDEVLAYGRFLAKATQAKPSLVAVDPDGRVVGLNLSTNVDPASIDASELPPGARVHWKLSCEMSDFVRGRLRRHRKADGMPETTPGDEESGRVGYNTFGGVVEQWKRTGLWKDMEGAHRIACREHGHTHVWGFTMNDAKVKSAFSSKSPMMDGKLAGVAGLLRLHDVGPALIRKLPTPAVMWIAETLSKRFFPPRVTAYAYPCHQFQYEGRKPLEGMGNPVIVTAVYRLLDNGWPENQQELRASRVAKL